MKPLLHCIAAGLALAWSSAQARPWKDANGRILEATQWRVEGETLYFMLNGREVPEPLAKLSPEDQAFVRQWAADHPAQPATTVKTAETKEAAKDTGSKASPKSHVEKLPNGDVIITNLPPVPFAKDVPNQLYITPALTLEKLYNWPTDLLSLAKKMGWDPKNDTFEEGKFYEAAAKAAHTRAVFAAKFDFDEAARHLSLGQPLIIWRCWGAARDETLIAFTKELRTHPDARLPSPHDAAERKKWPVERGASNSITSMVIGFNRQRGEVLLHIPNWDEDHTLFRMRKEELETSAYCVWYIDPK